MFYQMGFYNGLIDGIWGRRSRKATKKFQQKYKLKVDSIYGKKTNKKLLQVYKNFIKGNATDNDFKKCKYFSRKEFICKCGCNYNKVNKQLLYNLNTLRYYLSEKITISSGCRCLKHNKKVGGSRLSRHYNNLNGAKAADIITNKSKNLFERKNIINFWIKYLPNTRYGYCNNYYNNCGKSGYKKASGMGYAIHLDVK